MRLFYILDENRKVIPTDDVRVWGEFFKQSEKRRVGRTDIGDSFVSTVFLGLDHGFRPDQIPVLWETIWFGPGRREVELDRCAGTWEQAEAMHARMVERVKQSVKETNK